MVGVQYIMDNFPWGGPVYYIYRKGNIFSELVIVIARGQGFMAVNRPESEGAARGQGRFTLP